VRREVLVSVVIPAYNAAPFLAAAIGSVQRQAHAATQIIVVDDASTDETLALARAIPGVLCIAESHRGIGATRNSGIAAASGDLLAFLDADDLWADDKLARQLAVLESRPEVDLVGGRVEQFFDSPLAAPTAAAPPPAADGLMAGAMLIRRAAFDRVGTFRTDLAVGEFLDWHSRAVNCGLTMHMLSQVVLRRRIHGNNTVLKQRGNYANYLSVLKSHLDRKRMAA
jgi:glycosyltransferase involved in cell wall biosynthesis